MHGNVRSPRGLSSHDAVRQRAFTLGVEDFRKGRPIRDDLPPLDGIKDTPGNRQRVYETGRLVALYCRQRRRTLNAAAARAAKKAGYLP